MVTNNVIVNRDLPLVWKKIEAEFCKNFSCRPEELSGRKITTKTNNYYGKPINITQAVAGYNPRESITIQSINSSDVVSSTYSVEAVDASSTRVTLSVAGSNNKSVLRTWNYWLMSLPVLRSGTKKRLSMQLSRLKSLIENEGTH